MKRRYLAAVVGMVGQIGAGCTCAASHMGDATPHDVPDSASDGLVDDVAPGDDADAGSLADSSDSCNPTPPILLDFDTCTAEAEAACDRWARQAWVGDGYSHSACLDPGSGIVANCSIGDVCSGGGEPVPPCSCTATLWCGSGEVCVSDTPDGPRRCERACAPP